VSLISQSCGNITRVPLALGQYSHNFNIDLDASHYLHSTNKADRNNIVHVKLKQNKLNRGSNCKGLHVRLNTVNVCIIVCLRNALTQWWYICYTFQQRDKICTFYCWDT